MTKLSTVQPLALSVARYRARHYPQWDLTTGPVSISFGSAPSTKPVGLVATPDLTLTAKG